MWSNSHRHQQQQFEKLMASRLGHSISTWTFSHWTLVFDCTDAWRVKCCDWDEVMCVYVMFAPIYCCFSLFASFGFFRLAAFTLHHISLHTSGIFLPFISHFAAHCVAIATAAFILESCLFDAWQENPWNQLSENRKPTTTKYPSFALLFWGQTFSRKIKCIQSAAQSVTFYRNINRVWTRRYTTFFRLATR